MAHIKKRTYITIVFLLLLFCAQAANANDASNQLQNISVETEGNRVNLSFETTEKANFSSYFLKQPERFVVELFKTSISPDFNGFVFESEYISEISGNFQDDKSDSVEITIHLTSPVSYSFYYQNNNLHLMIVPLLAEDKPTPKESKPKHVAVIKTPVINDEHMVKPSEQELLRAERDKQTREDNLLRSQKLAKLNESLDKQQVRYDHEYQLLLKDEARLKYDAECNQNSLLRNKTLEASIVAQNSDQKKIDDLYAALIEEERAYYKHQQSLLEQQRRLEQQRQFEQQRLLEQQQRLELERKQKQQQKIAWQSKLDQQEQTFLSQYDAQTFLDQEFKRLIFDDETIRSQQLAVAKFDKTRTRQDKIQEQLLAECTRICAEQSEFEQAQQKRLAILHQQKAEKIRKQKEQDKLKKLPVKKIVVPKTVANLKKIGFYPSKTGSSIKLHFSAEVDVSYEWLSDYELTFAFTPAMVTSRINLLPLQTQAFGTNVLQIRPSMSKKDKTVRITIDLMQKVPFKVKKDKNLLELFFGKTP